jgi:hypothetical protein
MPQGTEQLVSTGVRHAGNVVPVERDPQTGRWLITPIQWVIAVLFGLVLIALTITLLRVPPRKERIYEWVFPQQQQYLWWQTVPAPSEGAVHFVPSNFTNVTQFYHSRFGVAMGSGTRFTSIRSSGFFGLRRRYSSLGFVQHRGAALNDTFVERNQTQAKIIHVCGAAGSTNSTVWIVMTPTQSAGRLAALPQLNGVLRFSGNFSANGSGGHSGDLAAYTDRVNANFSFVTNHYVTNFSTNSGPDSLRQQALTIVGEKKGRGAFLQLAATPMLGWPVPTNEAAFVFITSQTMSLIHAVAVSNETQVTVTSVAK